MSFSTCPFQKKSGQVWSQGKLILKQMSVGMILGRIQGIKNIISFVTY